MNKYYIIPLLYRFVLGIQLPLNNDLFLFSHFFLSIYISIRISIHLSIYLSFPSIYLLMYICIQAPFQKEITFINHILKKSFIRACIYLSIYVSIHSFISIHLSIFLSISLLEQCRNSWVCLQNDPSKNLNWKNNIYFVQKISMH